MASTLRKFEEELIGKLGDINKEDNDDSGGSDTDVSEDDLDDEFLINILPGDCLSKKQKRLKESLKEVLFKSVDHRRPSRHQNG